MPIRVMRASAACLNCLLVKSNNRNTAQDFAASHLHATYYVLEVLWGQPIKFAQVASTSELLENQWNDLVFFVIIPSDFCRASGVSKIKYENLEPKILIPS